jgi:recombination protein RecA
MAKQDKKSGAVASNADAAGKNPLAQLIARLNKDVGPGTIMMGRNQQAMNVDFISTGIATLDAVMGGGIPRGRIIEIFGAEGSGKTTTTLEIIASCQRTYFEATKRQGVCAFIDAEHALDPTWAKHLGVDMDLVLVNQPADGEEVFTVASEIVKSGAVDVVIIDSVAAMSPRDELDADISTNQIGAHARLMSKGLRILKGPVNESKTAVIFINQIRHKIGVMFGSPETTPGGNALKFYASVRVDLRRGETIKKDKDKPIGVTCKAKIIKNKVAPPYRSCVYNIYFGNAPIGGDEIIYGVDKVGCLFDAAVTHKVITQNSSFYYFDGAKIGNGRDKSVAAIIGSTVLADKIRAAIMVATSSKGVDLSDTTDDELDENLADVGVDGVEDTEEEEVTATRDD